MMGMMGLMDMKGVASSTMPIMRIMPITPRSCSPVPSCRSGAGEPGHSGWCYYRLPLCHCYSASSKDHE